MLKTRIVSNFDLFRGCRCSVDHEEVIGPSKPGGNSSSSIGCWQYILFVPRTHSWNKHPSVTYRHAHRPKNCYWDINVSFKKWLTFIPWYLPHRCKLVVLIFEMLSHLHMTTEKTESLFAFHQLSRNFFPDLLFVLYVHEEHSGSQTFLYEQCSIRYRIGTILESLWNIINYCCSAQNEARMKFDSWDSLTWLRTTPSICSTLFSRTWNKCFRYKLLCKVFMAVKKGCLSMKNVKSKISFIVW